MVAATAFALFACIKNEEEPVSKTVRFQVETPDKIYYFENETTSKTLYDYLVYLKDNEGLVVNIDTTGFVKSFYDINPSSSEFWMLFEDGKKSDYGVKSLNLKDGSVYTFLINKVSEMNAVDIPAPAAASGKKGVLVVVIRDEGTAVYRAISGAQTIGGLFDELNAETKDGISVECGNPDHPEYGAGFVNTVNDGKKEGFFWQVYTGTGMAWKDEYFPDENYEGGSEVYDVTTVELNNGMTVFLRENPPMS
jgi:hypothetical protein